MLYNNRQETSTQKNINLRDLYNLKKEIKNKSNKLMPLLAEQITKGI